jgi:uncharacterized protein YfaS (alpha-2-macroglobulin family)
MKKQGMALRFVYMALIMLFSFAATAQKEDTAFSREWEIIDSLIVKNDLTRTALQKLDILSEKARQRRLPAQSVKVLLYRYSLNTRITDNDPAQAIRSIEEELARSTEPTQQAVLHVLLAKKYQQYFEEHRWNLYNRRNTNEVNNKDITTWGADRFIKVIAEQYQAALTQKKLLQQTAVDRYDAILIKGNSRHARPTLYDLLAQEALAYFKHGEEVNPKPVSIFRIDRPEALADAAVFVRTDFMTRDSSSLQWRALNVFKDLLAFRLADPDKNALVILDLERLEWVHQKAILAEKDKLYESALQKLTDQYPSLPATAGAWSALARIYTSQAMQYSPFGDTSTRYRYNTAEQIVQKALVAFPDSGRYTAELKNLLAEINTKVLRTEIEKVNVPGKPFRALIGYRNTDMLYARIIRVNSSMPSVNNRWQPEYWEKILTTPGYKTLVQPLPATHDHQQHSTEIKIDALPVGEYILISSTGKGFEQGSDKLFVHYFHVSNISHIKNGNDYFILNRQTGEPMPKVKVSLLRDRYSTTLRETVLDTVSYLYSDNKGHFSYVPARPDYASVKFLFSTETDRLFLNEPDYSAFDYEEVYEKGVTPTQKQARNNRVFFFTDRSIYRPGQTVFFKGIAVTKDPESGQSKLMQAKDSAWVYLKDVNYKTIDSLRYGLNSFGSFNGKFILPLNTLTGQFYIEATSINRSMTVISVEEYKRPTFSVTFDKVKGLYRLNDSVTITGTAKAYAGNAIAGATVTFNVTRNMRYIPYPWLRKIPTNYNRREIMQGQVVTDASGKFTIRFKALADDITDSTGNPVFDFMVTADVTDNGETKTANTNITTGFAALQVNLNTQPVGDKDSARNIRISTTNMSNEKEPVLVQVKLYPLKTPDRPIRKRYWQRPDQFVMNRDEFIRYFPTDEYDNETDQTHWDSGPLLLEATVDTKNNDAWIIPAGSLPEGSYRIEAVARDRYGKEVKQQIYTQVFDRKTGLLPVPGYQFTHTVQGTVEPGQTASFLSGTSAGRIYVIRKTLLSSGRKNGLEYAVHTNGIRTISHTAQETDRGGLLISEAYVYDNRVYTSQFLVNVPWSNKQLRISYDTYRDKTEPGSPEKWTVSIQGNNSDSVAAELMTGMYDASLDQFRPHNWQTPPLWISMSPRPDFTGAMSFSVSHITTENQISTYYTQPDIRYDRLAFTAEELWEQMLQKLINNRTMPRNIRARKEEELQQVLNLSSRRIRVLGAATPNEGIRGAAPGLQNARDMDAIDQKAFSVSAKDASLRGNASEILETLPTITAEDMNGAVVMPPGTTAPVTIRKNFNETAFFFPQLYADATGKYSFSFTMPEALTQWKWMSFAHTKDLAFGSNSTTIITQKKLMVQPNAPRFMREGDNMELSSRIVNMTDQEIKGQASLELIDPSTNTSVDGWFHNVFPTQYFTAEAGQTVAVKFPVQIPFSYNKPLTWRIVARSENISDGEENTLPVLTNRTLVTETLPIFIPKDTTQQFVFDKLKNNTSESLTHESITVEYTSNPVWYAVQALPYLVEFPYECAEQAFNRFYANTLASYIINKHPRIKQVFEEWKKDSASLMSNLQKNEELKQLLIQETPWVLQAESETQKKKNLALLFDLARLSQQSETFIRKLEGMQLPEGSFSWFKGGYPDRYITNYILTGIGKLKRLGALTPDLAIRLRTVITKAIRFADARIAEDYKQLVNTKADLSRQQVSSTQIDYLFMRSFFRDIAQSSQQSYDYYYKQAREFWVKQNSYQKAQIGLIYLRNNDEAFARNSILPALLENTVRDTKMGMYWKTTHTAFWYQSPVEHQSMMIAFASELNLAKNETTLNSHINAMKTWLLLNKQTNNWRTTVATADACYALLLNGSDWLTAEKTVTIRIGNTTTASNIEKTEAGTGYFKKRIDGKLVNTEMGNITVSVNTTPKTSTAVQSPSWGSIYWQYFEDLDKITPAASPLSLTKKLFIERNTDKGKLLELVKENQELKIGDKIIVRMELRSDRDMDYLHLKDMRAASMEPVNVLSGYRWQDGLGYYESTRDASTNFFIDHLRKGTYVFEYPLFVTHAGVFSVGIANIQCMYAPEFTSHSEGIKIRVIP